ncbi:trypsin-like serine protease [Dactylosporangium salmoneum]|uniref:Peptidase S1 domain-containing protein n=1 Tax=Dactylosporangium salmoneum TaxID=53361 RepID=A0ABP5TND1_9ACTN
MPNRDPRLRLAGLAAVALMAVPTAALPVSPAFAGDATPTVGRNSDPQSIDNLDPATLMVMRQQEKLHPALQELWDAYYAEPAGSGFAGVAFEGEGLTLYWKGGLTMRMQASVARARKTGAVAVKAAAYSSAELQAEGQKIKDVIGKRSSDIQSIGYEPDGSGLHLKTIPSQQAARLEGSMRAREGRAPLAAAKQVLADAHVGVPVTIETAAEPIRLLSSRTDDRYPWNGGDRFESWRGSSHRMNCTTGFGVHSGGHSWVLTAGHCASTGDWVNQGTSGTSAYYSMGPVNSDDWRSDLLLIDAPGWHVIFDGGPVSSYTKPVHSWGYWAANEQVCQSGMKSGVVCGLKELRSADNMVDCDHPDSDGDCNYLHYGLILCTQVDGKLSGQEGDSGGPVFSLDGDGVRAKGITSAGGGSDFEFQDWADAIRVFGVYPNVSGSTA